MIFLFLGYPLTPSLEAAFKKCNPTVLAFFTSGGLYLEEVQVEERRYVGKKCPSLPSLQELDDLEANVLSLLKKMIHSEMELPSSCLIPIKDSN